MFCLYLIPELAVSFGLTGKENFFQSLNIFSIKMNLILVNVGSAWILLRQRENSYSSLQRSLFTYQAVMDVLYLVSRTLLVLLITMR